MVAPEAATPGARSKGVSVDTDRQDRTTTRPFASSRARTLRAIRHLLTVEETAATRGHAALAALAGRKAAQAMAQLAARRARFDRSDPRSVW
jgi:hypothetical protein